MPTAEDFAVRTHGKPWLATIGASTGPVITMVAPRNKGKTMGNFDWTDVTRHEFTHTVNLGATHHRIPRWFTEGLAVSEQTAPLTWDRYQILATRIAGNDLIPIRRLNWAFIRPKGKGGQAAAYAQSYWLCEYLYEKFGHAGILRLMNAYGEGLQPDPAFQKAFNLSTLQLDKDFKAWATAKAKSLGIDADSQKKTKSLQEEAQKLIDDRKYPEALALYQQCYAICPLDPLTNQRLAGLYLHSSVNQPQKAIPHLQALDREQLKSNAYALRLAGLFENQNDLPKAITSALRASYINPYDPKPRELLIQLYTKSNNPEAAQHQQGILNQVSIRPPDTSAR
jgi:tetratricopeptide (TPR) repeat protein